MSEEEVVESTPQLGEGVSEEVKSEAEPQYENGKDTEAEAREFGWKPKEEYGGDGWVDAEEFLKRGQQKRGDLYRELEISRGKIEQLTEGIEELKRYMSNAEKSGYDKALRELEAQRNSAIESGDPNEVRKYDEQYFELKSKAQEAKNKAEGPSESMARAAENFKQRNANWFNHSSPENIDMMDFAREQEIKLLNNHPEMPYDNVLEVIEYRVKKSFPDKFRNKNRDMQPPVDSGESSLRSSPRSKLNVKDLPEEQLMSAKKMIQQGLFKDMNEFLETIAPEWRRYNG